MIGVPVSEENKRACLEVRNGEEEIERIDVVFRPRNNQLQHRPRANLVERINVMHQNEQHNRPRINQQNYPQYDPRINLPFNELQYRPRAHLLPPLRLFHHHFQNYNIDGNQFGNNFQNLNQYPQNVHPNIQYHPDNQYFHYQGNGYHHYERQGHFGNHGHNPRW